MRGRRGRARLPTTTALVAFESVARLGSFSRAAVELGTSQPAISRHIAAIERQVSKRLFDRTRTGVELTDAGQRFHARIVEALELIFAGSAEASGRTDEGEVIIACADEAAQLVVLPRYDALRQSLGARVLVRIVAYYGSVENLPAYPLPHIVLSWNAPRTAPEDRVVVLREAVRPVCSPGYAEAHANALAGPVTGWGALTFLYTDGPKESWVRWEDYFEIAGWPRPAPSIVGFDFDSSVLSAASVGGGIALGWRGYVDTLVESGTLVLLADRFVEFDNAYEAVLTAAGRTSNVARRCLGFFERLV